MRRLLLDMNVLLNCECSGVVRDAMIARGHNAISCDLEPSERPGPHIQGDAIIAARSFKWDLMIAFPPCTYLANSSNKWLYGGKGTVRDEERWRKMEEGCQFYADLWNSNIPKVAIENPIQHGHAKKRLKELCAFLTEPQYVQPYWFGHAETKATGFRFRGLPQLKPSNFINGPYEAKVHYASPGPDRGKDRSRTLKGIGDALAEQWGGNAT